MRSPTVTKKKSSKARFDAVIEDLGFPPPTDVRNHYSIGGLLPNTRNRTGIYLLVLEGGSYYIGLAKDVVRRFGQHRRNFGARLVGLSFQRIPLLKLEAVERRLIQLAERLGLPLEQVEWKSQVYGSTDLEAVFNDAEYAAWKEDPEAHFAADQSSLAPAEAGRRARDDDNYSKLLRHELGPRAMDAARHFIACCVPYARSTASDFWSISCLPSTNRQFAPRLLCVPAHVLEILVLGHDKGDNTSASGFLVCARSPLEQHYGSLAKAARALRVEAHESNYKSAGFDQCQLFFDGIDSLTRIIDKTPAREAAQLLVYRVMQKGVNRYANFHCTTLAEVMLQPTR